MGAKTIPDWGFVGPSNPTDSHVQDGSYSINLYYEPNYGPAKSKAALLSTPGYGAPVVTLANAPIRGLFPDNGVIWAVGGGASAGHFYSIDASSFAVTDYGSLAPGGAAYPQATDLCQSVTNGTQRLIMDPTVGHVFLANNGTLTAEFNALALEYLDGFFLAIAVGTSKAGSNPNQINASAFGDGTSWPALSYALKEGSSDTITRLAVVRNLLWVFGQDNIEIWYNAGNNNFPLARVNGGTINVGCISPESVVKVNDAVLWLGSSERGYGQVYISDGLTAQRVSTPAIEAALMAVGAKTMGFAYAHAEEIDGHTFYVLSLDPSAGTFWTGPNTTISGLTVAYDLTTKMWHFRAYWDGSQLETAAVKCWATIIPDLFNSLTSASYNFCSIRTIDGLQNSQIFLASRQYTSDNGQTRFYGRVTPAIASANRWMRHASLEIDADVGTAQIGLAWSDDGGRTWPHSRDPISGSNDQGGAFERFVFRQLGRSRDRRYSVAIFDSANQIALINGYARVSAGAQMLREDAA